MKILILLSATIVLFAVNCSAESGILTCQKSLAPSGSKESASDALWAKWEADFRQTPTLTQVRSMLLNEAKQPGFVARMRSMLVKIRSELHSNSQLWLSTFTQTPGGIEDVDVVIVGGVHATTTSAALADQLRALASKGLLRRVPRVLFINDADEPTRFVGQTFLLNTPFRIKSDDSGHSELYDFDPVPYPGSPIDLVTIHMGLSSDGLFHKTEGLESEALLAPVPASDGNRWLTKPWTHVSYLYPQASWFGDAALLADKYSTIPVLLGTRITKFEREDLIDHKGRYLLVTNRGFTVRAPILIMMPGQGDDNIPFSDSKSQASFQEARSLKLAGTISEFLDWSSKPGFFESLKGEKILVIGGYDSGNMIVQRLKGLEPRGTHYLLQASKETGRSIDLYWAGQPAKNKEEFISDQVQYISTQKQVRDVSFRKPLYESLGGLFGDPSFHPTAIKTVSMSLLPNRRLHVTFDDGHTEDFGRIYLAAGYNHDNGNVNQLGSQWIDMDGVIQSPASSNFGKSLLLGTGVSDAGLLLLGGSPLGKSIEAEGKLEVNPDGELNPYGISLENSGYRAAAIPELIIEKLEKLGMVGKD